MGDEKKMKAEDKLCLFTSDDENDASNLLSGTRTLSELTASSDKCIKAVTEQLDQIEAEILAGEKDAKTD